MCWNGGECRRHFYLWAAHLKAGGPLYTIFIIYIVVPSGWTPLDRMWVFLYTFSLYLFSSIFFALLLMDDDVGSAARYYFFSYSETAALSIIRAPTGTGFDLTDRVWHGATFDNHHDGCVSIWMRHFSFWGNKKRDTGVQWTFLRAIRTTTATNQQRLWWEGMKKKERKEKGPQGGKVGKLQFQSNRAAS